LTQVPVSEAWAALKILVEDAISTSTCIVPSGAPALRAKFGGPRAGDRPQSHQPRQLSAGF
jgi:hypothetical protein